jgi:hypothetical protein
VRITTHCTLVIALLGTTSCDGLRRASLKTVDPTVQKNPRWERERAKGGFRLGPYTVLRPELRETAIDEDRVTGGAESAADMTRKPGWRWHVALTVRGPDREYVALCTGLRVPTIIADYGEVADVNNDEVRIDCDVQGDQKWRLSAQGRLDKNVGGELRALDADSAAPMKLEILLWAVRLKLVRRHLAAPVVQMRRDRTTVAALIMERPEWAWVAAGESAEIRGVALTTLLAIQALPLGWDE